MQSIIMRSNPLILVIGIFFLLSGCTRSISEINADGTTGEPNFPEVNSAVVKEGSFVNVDNLSKVRPNLTKHQVYELLGIPHFNEGVFRVKEWDYIFHFDLGNKVLSCQYKVTFDSSLHAQGFYFKPSDCMSQLTGAMEKKDDIIEHKSISAEALFKFNSAVLTENGKKSLADFSKELTLLKIKKMVITGHTDRFGTSSYNNSLSLARANAVRDYLASRGVASAVMSAIGAGSQIPRVICPGAKVEPVIACLSPNRRVTIDIIH